MTMYNTLFDTNPYTNVLLMALGITQADVPAFRDCYLDDNGDIVIFTRTGGRNRDMYEDGQRARQRYPEYFDGSANDPKGPWNADLRLLDGFKCDADDEFDHTYARFYFAPPAALADALKEIAQKQGNNDPNAAFRKLMSDIQNSEVTPDTERALNVSKRIFSAIYRGQSY